MEKSLAVPKHERRWQFGIYVISILFMTWDLFIGPFIYVLNIFISIRPFVIPITLLLLCIGWLVTLKSPRLGARIAIVASTISLVFYLLVGFINLISYGYDYFDMLRFYLLRIFIFGVVYIYSYKILHSSSEQGELLIPMLFFKLRWTPKKQRQVMLVFIIMFGVLGVQWFYPRASCATIGGEWIRDGMIGQAQYCLHSYPDAGKACQNSDDCMGSCLVDTNSSSAETGIPTAGVCAPSNRVFGCFDYFENQEIYSWCVD